MGEILWMIILAAVMFPVLWYALNFFIPRDSFNAGVESMVLKSALKMANRDGRKDVADLIQKVIDGKTT